MSDDEADDAGARLADAYADEFEEEDADYGYKGPKAKKAKTSGKKKEEASKQAWCLCVKMKFKDYGRVIKLKDLLEPYALWVHANESNTLAYQLMTSDKDPLTVCIFERYVDKDSYEKVHKSSDEFQKLRPAIEALEPEVDGHSYYEGSGYMARSDM